MPVHNGPVIILERGVPPRGRPAFADVAHASTISHRSSRATALPKDPPMPLITTTAERPLTTLQRRIRDACAASPGKSRAAIARELGLSRERVRQALAVIRTKQFHQQTAAISPPKD